MLSPSVAGYTHPSVAWCHVCEGLTRPWSPAMEKKKKSRDFLDILPTLRLKYTQCTKAFCGAQRWTEPVACGGVGVGKLWWQSSERRYRPVKLNPPLAERCPGRVLDVKCSRSVKLFLHETQSIPPSSLRFGLIWSCQLRLKSLSLKAFLYHT